MTNLIVCPEIHAVKVAQDIFARGGSAMDAAISAAFVQCVTNPMNCGIGGGGTLYYYDAATRQDVILNCEVAIGSHTVPESWAHEIQREIPGQTFSLRSRANEIGYQAIMVPGLVKGLWCAFERFASGRLSWAELLAPSIRLAREGFEIPPYSAVFWRGLESLERARHPTSFKLNATPQARHIYLKPDGSIYQSGDPLLQSDLAHSLERLAVKGGDDFYKGEIASIIAYDIEKHNGLITSDDLANYTVDVDAPLRAAYRGLELAAQPFSNGAFLTEMLQVLEQFEVASLRHNSADYIDLVARVMRACYADYVWSKGRSRNELVSIESRLSSRERALELAQQIKRGDRIAIQDAQSSRGTTQLNCMDEHGNIVLLNHTIGLAGSGVVSPGLGFLYNADIAFFNPDVGQPNSISPRKKMVGGSPLAIFKEGGPYLLLGSLGGTRISTSIVQTVLNVIEHEMDIRTAVTAPRFHSQSQDLIFLEPLIDNSIALTLEQRGNQIAWSTYMACVQAILVRPTNGQLEAGADPRWGGGAFGSYPYMDWSIDPAFS